MLSLQGYSMYMSVRVAMRVPRGVSVSHTNECPPGGLCLLPTVYVYSDRASLGRRQDPCWSLSFGGGYRARRRWSALSRAVLSPVRHETCRRIARATAGGLQERVISCTSSSQGEERIKCQWR